VETLNRRERVSYRLHLIYSICEGVIEGVFLLSSFVFVKTLLGGDYQISILFQSMVGIYIVSLFANEWISRVENLKRMLVVSGFATRLPLFLFLFFGTGAPGKEFFHILYLCIFALFYSSRTFVFPVINLFLKQAYRQENFGELYGRASTYRKSVIIASTFLFGLLSDYDAFAFRYVFPLCGVLGIVSVFIFTRIPYRLPTAELKRRGVVETVRDVVAKMFRIGRSNVPYLHFELSFMLYGVGFMLTFPVITIYFDDTLQLNYSSVSFYQYYFNLLSVFMLPFFGKLMGRIDPRSFGAITFSAMCLFVLSFIVSYYWPDSDSIFGVQIHWALLAGYSFYGVFMASNTMLYHVGSSYFCEKEHAGLYQSLHLSLTGVRGLVFPLAGVWVYQTFGFVACFSVAATSLMLGVGVLLYSKRKLRLGAA